MINNLFVSHKYHFKCLGFITDRSNSLPISSNTGSALPKFTDVKIFVDSLLIEYQTNHPIQYELERNLMTCTPFRNDFLFSKIDKIFANVTLTDLYY
jgi:hypothetical protein